jgi:hypothetical protein
MFLRGNARAIENFGGIEGCEPVTLYDSVGITDGELSSKLTSPAKRICFFDI